jgi:hypothetical protein
VSRTNAHATLADEPPAGWYSDEPDPARDAMADMIRDPASIGGYIDDSAPFLLQKMLDIIYRRPFRSDAERITAMRQAVISYRTRAADEYAGRVRRMAR